MQIKKQLRVPNYTYMRNHHHVGTPGLQCPKKTCTDVINTLHVCPNWCLSVFENLSTVHRKVCGDSVFTICLARQRKRGDDIISLPSGAYREPGLVVKTIDHQGWTRYIWCHDDVQKRVTLGYLWCEVVCWKSPEKSLRERKCHLW